MSRLRSASSWNGQGANRRSFTIAASALSSGEVSTYIPPVAGEEMYVEWHELSRVLIDCDPSSPTCFVRFPHRQRSWSGLKEELRCALPIGKTWRQPYWLSSRFFAIVAVSDVHWHRWCWIHVRRRHICYIRRKYRLGLTTTSKLAHRGPNDGEVLDLLPRAGDEHPRRGLGRSQ